MGLLDQVTDSWKGAVGQMLGQSDPNKMPDMLSQMMGQTGLGDVNGLLNKLQQGGLGSQVSSWLGNGPNLPVSSDQLRSALGNQHVQQIAGAFGLSADKILAMLSQFLPGTIDQMSPNGKIEQR